MRFAVFFIHEVLKKGQTGALERHSMKNRAQQIQLFHQPVFARGKVHLFTPPFVSDISSLLFFGQLRKSELFEHASDRAEEVTESIE